MSTRHTVRSGLAPQIGRFMGAWGSEYLATTLNMPSALHPSMTAYSEGSGGATWVSTPLDSGQPAGYVGYVTISANFTSSGHAGGVSINMASLNVPGITRMSCWIDDHNDGFRDNEKDTRLLVGANLMYTQPGPFAWTKIGAACASTDTVKIEQRGNASGVGQSAGSQFTGVDVYAVVPYSLGDVVTYAGRLWRSGIDKNVSVPGADANWVNLPIDGKTVNAQTGTSFTPQFSDAAALVTLNNASAITVTLPVNYLVPFPIGSEIEFCQLGAGQVTLAGAAGVTVNATPGLKSLSQYSVFGVVKIGTNTWLAYGRLAA